MNNNVNKYINSNIFFILLSGVIIIPIIVFAANSIPAVDDFANASTLRDEYLSKNASMFFASLKMTGDYYVKIGGYYFSLFLNLFSTPLLRGGVTGVRIFNVLAYIFYFISLFFLVSAFKNNVLKNKTKSVTWPIFLIILCMTVNSQLNSEIYTWYCVIVAYIIPISFLFISCGLYFCGTSKHKKYYIISGILTFLVSGSSLNVTALNCGVFFVLGLYTFKEYNEKKYNVIVFMFAMIGAIINVLSPGNFTRRGKAVDNFEIFEALKGTFVVSLESVIDRLIKSPFLLCSILLLLIFLFYADYGNSNMKCRHPFLMLPVILLGVMIVNFPVVLGYSNKAVIAYHGRTFFVQDLALYFLAISWIYYFSAWINLKFGRITIKKEGIALFFICIILYCQCFISNIGIRNFTTGRMIAEIFYGDLKVAVKYEETVLYEIMTSETEEAIITVDLPIGESEILKRSGITTDSESWINKVIANYYNKTDIIFYKEEKE